MTAKKEIGLLYIAAAIVVAIVVLNGGHLRILSSLPPIDQTNPAHDKLGENYWR